MAGAFPRGVAVPPETVAASATPGAWCRVSRAYGDPVNVWLVDGRPSRFVWQGRLYTVLRVLDHWVTTRDWWRDRNPEAEEATAREFWQVEASPDKEIGVYELRFDEASGGWMLSRAWD